MTTASSDENKDRENKRRSRLRCREIMTRKVTTARQEMSLQDLAVLMRDGDMGALPVVDEANKLVGIVTDRDIVVRAIADGKDCAAATAGEVMTKDLFTAKPEDFVFQAIRLMGDKQVRRIPIVDENGILQGILAMADIALEVEDEREIAETLEDISSGAAFWNKN
jgi:CBS domain-containing protein